MNINKLNFTTILHSFSIYNTTKRYASSDSSGETPTHPADSWNNVQESTNKVTEVLKAETKSSSLEGKVDYIASRLVFFREDSEKVPDNVGTEKEILDNEEMTISIQTDYLNRLINVINSKNILSEEAQTRIDESMRERNKVLEERSELVSAWRHDLDNEEKQSMEAAPASNTEQDSSVNKEESSNREESSNKEESSKAPLSSPIDYVTKEIPSDYSPIDDDMDGG